MNKLAMIPVLVLVIFLLGAVVALAEGLNPPHYFGPGSGYKDFGSAKYFYNYYPPQDWGRYGYGTGALGQGYGPYIYGGRQVPRTAEDLPNFGLKVQRPQVKWLGGSKVRVMAPEGPAVTTCLTVEVLSWNGTVMEVGSSTCAPFVVVANIPEGSTNLRIKQCFPDGFNSTVVTITPAH